VITTARVYDFHGEEGAIRILVDGIWPRGLTKQEVNADYWFKEVAPSAELRKWYSHQIEKWNDFKKRYFEELDRNQKVNELLEICRYNDVVFLYASRETKMNNATALKEYVEGKLEGVL